MKCETAIDLVVDSMVDDLSVEELADLKRHLASCHECANKAAEMDHLWKGLEGVDAPAPSGDILVRFGRQLERTGRRPAWPLALRAAAAIALLLAGGLAGRLVPDGPIQGQRAFAVPEGSYLLAIRGTEPDRRADGRPLMPEYVAWESDLERDGILLAAEKLMDGGGRWVSGMEPGEQDPGSLELRGFFLIRAASYDEAVSIASTSPHITYGGTIEVRQIQKTARGQ